MLRRIKSIVGVTLLETMLVLAIAGMIVVFSVRYYQSAAASNQANAFVGQIIAIIGAEETLAQSEGAYLPGTDPKLIGYLPKNGLITPWATTLTITPGTGSFTITVPNLPPTVCAMALPRLLSNARLAGSTCASITYQ